MAIAIFAFPILLAGCSDGADGKDGQDGADGAQWYSGTQSPSASQGNDGDYYIDTDDYILYQKADGTWVVLMTDFGKPGENGADGKDGADGQDGADGTSIYIGYDGYVWTGNSRSTLQLVTNILEDNTVAETTLGLYGNEIHTEKTISTSGNYIVLMNSYFENISMTGYSDSYVSGLSFYSASSGTIQIGTASVADVVTARLNGSSLSVTPVSGSGIYAVNKGLNTITFSTELHVSETDTLVLGGDYSSVDLYSYVGVGDYDEWGYHTIIDGKSHETVLETTNDCIDKLAIKVYAYALNTTTEEGSESTATIVVDGTKAAGADMSTVSASGRCNPSSGYFVTANYADFTGETITSIEVYVFGIGTNGTASSAKSGEATLTLYVIDTDDIGTTNWTFDNSTTITLTTDVTVGQWNKIYLDEAITLGENEAIAFVNPDTTTDTLIVGYVGGQSYTSYGYNNTNGATLYRLNQNGDTEETKTYTYGIWAMIRFEYDEVGTAGITTTDKVTFAEHIQILQEQENEAYATAYSYSFVSGLNVSILGDSISTFAGVSNSGSANDTINANYLARYASTSEASSYASNAGDDNNTATSGIIPLDSVDDTWWMKTINELNMNLLVNNSWRGTKVLGAGSSSGSSTTSDGWQTRCVNLHDNTLEDNENEEEIDPDIIAVFLGMNDWINATTLGTFSNDLSSLVSDNGDGTYSYTTPTTFAEAYFVMIHKMIARYPNATIFCFTLEPVTRTVSHTISIESYNQIIRQIANYFNLPIVDLYNDSGITSSNAASYQYDTVHPNADGIELVSQCFTEAVLEYFKPL